MFGCLAGIRDAGMAKMYRVPPHRAKLHAVGDPLEQGVPHWALDGC
jgi:hypothetical protein